MDDIDKAILNRIQTDFPVVKRPFKEIGLPLDCSEEEVIRRIKLLKNVGVIRRIGGNFNSRNLGFTTTLCAAKVPVEKVSEFVDTVNNYPGVTHNYLRDHDFNVWFTFIGSSAEEIEKNIQQIEKDTGIKDIVNLPALKLFKILVDFKLS